MTFTILHDLIYLLIAVPLTIRVASTGKVFLVDCFCGNTELADSGNHLLVAGFYLLNIGFVTLFLRLKGGVADYQDLVEALSNKIGIITLVLGMAHLTNLYLFNHFRNKAIALNKQTTTP